MKSQLSIIKFFSTLSVLFMASGATLPGALDFEKSSLQVTTELNAEKAGGSFGFTNSGDTLVTITDVKTSCGCTTATLDKKDYAPGESGKIDAYLTIGQREGKQSKQIRVFTDDPAHPVYRLTLKTDIPKILDIRPRLLYWENGSEPDAKTLTVTILYPDPVRITGLSTSNPSFQATLEPIEEGRKYAVTVDPGSTEASQRGAVYFQTDLTPKPTRQFFAHLRVQ